MRTLGEWFAALPDSERFEARSVLSFAQGAREAAALAGGPSARRITVLSGPEGGLSAAEEADALHRGFAPLTLGPRILRAETAAIAALVSLAG